MKWQRILATKELKRGQTVKFEFERGGVKREGFVACFQGRVVAYENVCRHIPMAMDDGEGQFFDRDGKYFICQTHHAVYEPLTGLCVRGPCEGAKLKPVRVRVRGGFIETATEEADDGDEWRHKDWR